MSSYNRCAYIRRDQTQCPTRLRGDNTYCYKHRNSQGAKANDSTKPYDLGNTPDNYIKNIDYEEEDITASEAPPQPFTDKEVEDILFDTLVNKKKKEIAQKKQLEIQKKKVDISNLDEDGLIKELERQVKSKPVDKDTVKSIGVKLLDIDAITEDEFRALLLKYVK